jgi:hypothetical protein
MRSAASLSNIRLLEKEPGFLPRQSKRYAGRIVEPVLDAMGITYHEIESEADVSKIAPAIETGVGILAPAKTPTEICAKLNAAVNQVVVRPEVDKRLRQLGYEPYVGTLADAPAFLTRQIDTWGNLIRATGIAAE